MDPYNIWTILFRYIESRRVVYATSMLPDTLTVICRNP